MSVDVGSRWSILYTPLGKGPKVSRKLTVDAVVGDMARCRFDHESGDLWIPVRDFDLPSMRPLVGALR